MTPTNPQGEAAGQPNPGSDEAIDQGCTCPVWDNGRGRGYMGQPGIFVMTASCPLHGVKGTPDDQA